MPGCDAPKRHPHMGMLSISVNLPSRPTMTIECPHTCAFHKCILPFLLQLLQELRFAAHTAAHVALMVAPGSRRQRSPTALLRTHVLEQKHHQILLVHRPCCLALPFLLPPLLQLCTMKCAPINLLHLHLFVLRIKLCAAPAPPDAPLTWQRGQVQAKPYCS